MGNTSRYRDKPSAKQNSGIGMNYLVPFFLTYGFHFLFFILKQELEENFEINS